MSCMVVPWSEIPARKWAKVGKPIAAHEFCKRLLIPDLPDNGVKHARVQELNVACFPCPRTNQGQSEQLPGFFHRGAE